MAKINRYPRGYLAVVDSAGLGIQGQTNELNELPFDPEVEALYKLFINRTVSTTSWQFRARVVTCAARLFGNFHQWLALQAVGNDFIYDLNFEFLKDTVQFIRTGHRDMSVFNWQELLMEHPDARPGAASPRRLDEFRLTDSAEFENVIGMWCSKEGGFEDMICTVHVLYGVSKRPLYTPVPNLI